MQGESSSQLLREFMTSGTNLVRSEITLAKEELKETGRRLERHFLETLFFGVLALLAILPFLAFLVLGLGEVLGGRYWLSALVVAVVLGAVGALFGYRAYRKFKSEDLSLPRTRGSIDRERHLVKNKIAEMGAAIQGSSYDYGK